MEQDYRPELVLEIAEKAILLFSDQQPEKVEKTSIRTDCFLVFGYKGKSAWAVMITLSRSEPGQATVTVHDVNSPRHDTRIYSFEREASGEFAIHLNAQSV